MAGLFIPGVIALIILISSTSQVTYSIGQPLIKEQASNLTGVAQSEDVCVGRQTFCESAMSMMDSLKSTISKAQAELASGNNTAVKSLLDNASQVVSSLSANMSSVFRLGG
jgi:hypothetical protein